MNLEWGVDAWEGAEAVREEIDCPICGKDSCEDPTHRGAPQPWEQEEPSYLPPEWNNDSQGAAEEKQKRSSWAPVDLGPVLDGGATDPPPAVLKREDEEPLFYAGINWLSGEPESGKTWLALLACQQEIEAGQTVAFIDFEDTAAKVVGRLRALGVEAEAIAARFLYVSPEEASEKGRTEIEALLSRRPSLIVVDAVSEAMAIEGLDPEKLSQVADWMQRLPRLLVKSGAAVVLLDHVVKNTENRGRFAIGSGHKLACVTGAAYGVEAVLPFARGQDGKARIYLHKDRNGWVPFERSGKARIVGELHARGGEGGTLRLIIVPPVPEAEFRPTVLMERVSRELERRTEAASLRSIRETVRGKAAGIAAALECLRGGDHVTVEVGPRNATLYRHVRPYREDNDRGTGSRDGGTGEP